MMKTWLFLFFILALIFPNRMLGQGLTMAGFEKDRGHPYRIFSHSLLSTAGTFFYGETAESYGGTFFFRKTIPDPTYLSSSAAMGNLLPRWTPESLPFFCLVEHDCGKKLPFACKFRLGSVEYVDWLEGKNTWLGQY